MNTRSRFSALFAILTAIVLVLPVAAEKIGPNLVRDPSAPAAAAPAVTGPAKAVLYAYLGREIEKGNFVLLRTLIDPGGATEHRRFEQLYEGLPVRGGEIVQHLRGGKVESYDGDFYRVAGLDLVPKRTEEEALASCRAAFRRPDITASAEGARLVVFPVDDQDFRLAYEMTVEKRDTLFLERVDVDASSGEVLAHHSLIQVEDPLVGTGTGIRNDQLKFPTTLSGGTYYMMDAAKARPISQRTFEGNHQYGGTIYLSSSNDNTWAKNSIVNAHAYIGLVYDFYYIVFHNQGIDNKNGFALNSFVHIFDVANGLTDNAFFLSENSMYGAGMYFLDPYYGNKDYAACLDVVAHECSHGVTAFTGANLTYWGESGALNESFSDIMGTAVEFYFQPEGTGYNMADWANGEDGGPTFAYTGCRRQDDPNQNSQLKNAGAPSSLWYPDPCHISQKIPTLYTSTGQVFDNDNVHINMTIFPHLFYLLAHGGTNPVSKLSVTGIGLEAAQKIIWQAFIKHMTASTNFLGAANAILQGATDLYGASSAEVAQTKNAIRAIGYTVN